MRIDQKQQAEVQRFPYQYINTTVDLCTVLNGALCPLPQYNFDGNFVYVLPSSLWVDSLYFGNGLC